MSSAFADAPEPDTCGGQTRPGGAGWVNPMRLLDATLPQLLVELVRRHDNSRTSEDDRALFRDIARLAKEHHLVGVPPATARRVRAFWAAPTF